MLPTKLANAFVANAPDLQARAAAFEKKQSDAQRQLAAREQTFQRNFATGLINVVFDPDYARNGIFFAAPATATVEPSGRSSFSVS